MESNAKPTSTGPTAILGMGGSQRPFTLKNLEAPRNFSRIKQIVVTT